MKRLLSVVVILLAFAVAGVTAPKAKATACTPNSFYYTIAPTTVANGQTWSTQMSIGFAGITGNSHVLVSQNARYDPAGSANYGIEVGLFSGYIGDGYGNTYYTAGVAPYASVTDDGIHYNTWQGSNVTPGTHQSIWLYRSGNIWTSYINGSAIQANDLVGIANATADTEDAVAYNNSTCDLIDAVTDQSNLTFGSIFCAINQTSGSCGGSNNNGCRFAVKGGLNKGFESYKPGTSPYWGCVSAYNNCPPNCPAAPTKAPGNVAPIGTNWSIPAAPLHPPPIVNTLVSVDPLGTDWTVPGAALELPPSP